MHQHNSCMCIPGNLADGNMANFVDNLFSSLGVSSIMEEALQNHI